jgi:hypothetical protein
MPQSTRSLSSSQLEPSIVLAIEYLHLYKDLEPTS